jgi:hypothetical protein
MTAPDNAARRGPTDPTRRTALVAGILILVVPRLLNFIVAIYLIAIGLLGLIGTGSLHV